MATLYVGTAFCSLLRRPNVLPSTSRPFIQCWPRSVLAQFAAATTVRVPDNSSFVLAGERIYRPRSSNEATSVTVSHILATSSSTKANNCGLLRWLSVLWASCRDALFVFSRGSEIILRFLPLALLTPASILADKWSGTPIKRTNFLSDWSWSYTRSAITALGPAFVKLFQWVATRRDVFPPNVCDRLSVLHDRGIPHPWKDSHAALAKSFGEDYQEKGLCVERDSIIGCGSAAQVYKGTLRTDDGVHHAVAVKVLHPLLLERVLRDLHFVRAVVGVVHSLPFDRIRMLNLPRAVDNFGSILLRQTNLSFEADNLVRFRKNFYRNKRDENDSAICFPKPFDGWVGPCVLVEELVDDATPISAFLQDTTDEGVRLRKELASPLLRAFLKMVFLDNHVHGDLHMGNIMITATDVAQNRSTWSSLFGRTGETVGLQTKRQIVFIDAGISISLNENDQRNLVDLFRAVILNNGNQAGRLMVERAQYERCSQTPGGVDSFAKGIEELVAEFHNRRKDGLTLGTVQIGSLLGRVLDLCRVHGVEIDPNMSSIVVSTLVLVLEGLGRSLDPNLNLIDFALPFVVTGGRV